MCRILGVTKSGYFAWRGRPESTRKNQDAKLKAEIEQVYTDSKGRYGVPRVHAELRARSQPCSRRRVARLMHEAGLRGKVCRKYKSTTQSDHDHPLADDLVQRDFKVNTPNTVWAADISYLPSREGWFYLAVVLDLHSRRVVGWAMGERLTTELPLAALQMAFTGRRPPPGLIHHSDRGSQYTSRAYRRALAARDALASMGKKGDCFDNAVVESFFSTLKRELLLDHVFSDTPRGANAGLRVR